MQYRTLGSSPRPLDRNLCPILRSVGLYYKHKELEHTVIIICPRLLESEIESSGTSLPLESAREKQTGITSKMHRRHFTIQAMISKVSSNNIDQGLTCCFGSSVISFSHPWKLEWLLSTKVNMERNIVHAVKSERVFKWTDSRQLYRISRNRKATPSKGWRCQKYSKNRSIFHSLWYSNMERSQVILTVT